MQVLITLQYLASNTFHIHIGDAFNVSKSSVSDIVERVTSAIAKKASKFIKFPKGQAEAKSKFEFMEYCQFPMTIGAIDCTHIWVQVKQKIFSFNFFKIFKPPGTDEKSYVNRKLFRSINTQAIADKNCKFINIDANWPGSTHDSFILK